MTTPTTPRELASGHHGSLQRAVLEFCGALTNPLTYSPRRNHEVVFGFLWGLPVPIFAVLIYAYGAGLAPSPAVLALVLEQHPLFIVFFLHPLLFAAIFGALGTMRQHREQRIQALLLEVERHCDQLEHANERLTELDRLKSEFLANVTHELKSPLVTALGYTDLTLMEKLGPLTEKQRRGLEVSKRNLIRLRTLIEEILDFSRLETGMARFNLQLTTLNAAIQTAVENAALKLRDRRITVDVEAPERAPVLGDHAKLLQVVVNLLDNAIKFSPEGSRVQIKVERTNGNWRLSVTDQGCGIPPEKMAHVFERFFQADGSLSRVYEGVGLGLVIVRKIVEGHGGKIWVESRTGSNSGTSVILEIPVATEPHAEPALTENEKEVANAAHSNH